MDSRAATATDPSCRNCKAVGPKSVDISLEPEENKNSQYLTHESAEGLSEQAEHAARAKPQAW